MGDPAAGLTDSKAAGLTESKMGGPGGVEAVGQAAGKTAGRPGGLTRWRRAIVGVLSVLTFLVIWELAMPLGWMTATDISRPSLVMVAFFKLVAAGEVLPHVGVSLQSFFSGFILALAVGVPLGVLLGRFRILSLLFDPLLTTLYTTPRLAMLPLLVAWFGIGKGATAAVVFLGAVFPVLVNTAVGIREVDPVWVRAVRSFGGGEWDIFTKVLLPGALPVIFTGIRLAVGRGVMGVVVGEMYTPAIGLGSQIALFANSFRTAELIALITIVTGFGVVVVEAVQWVERRLQRPRMAE